MKHFCALCLIALAMTSIGCDSGSGPGGGKPIHFVSDYMPLSVGNTWTYIETFDAVNGLFVDTITYTITRQVMMSGKLYMEYMPTRDTIWLQNGEWAYLYLDTAYYRVEEPGRVYLHQDTGEVVYLDFSTQFDPARWSYLPISFERDTFNVSVPAGTFSNCVKLRGGYNSMLVEFYARGVGLIAQDFGGPYRRLMSARVGGRSWP